MVRFHRNHTGYPEAKSAPYFLIVLLLSRRLLSTVRGVLSAAADPGPARPPVLGPSSLAAAPRPGRAGLRGWLAPGLLHALVLDAAGPGLRHYERAQERPDQGWARLDLVSPDAVGPGALVVASGVLHALVPEDGGIAHHVKAALPRVAASGEHTLDPNTWGRRGEPLPGSTVTATRDARGVLAAVGDDDGTTLWRFEGGWRRTEHLPGARDVLVAPGAVVADLGGELSLRLRGAWRRLGLGAGTASGSLVADAGGWLLAVPRGDVLETWRIGRDGAVTPHATLTWGAGTIDGVALAPAGRGAVHALTDEAGSVLQHRRHAAGGAWMRVTCLRLHDTSPFTVEERESTKLAQVSGETDTQPVREGGRRLTLSRSTTRSGVLGTDLGVRVEHLGDDLMVFGDTHWHRRPWLTTRDAIARIDPTGPIDGLPGFTFHGAPLRVRGWGVTMREYDVPLDAFSVGDDLYGFFTSNHFRRGQVMGRSVLAVHRGPVRVDPRSRRPVTFTGARTFSERYFINVSVQRLPGSALGLPREGEVLAVWGSGSYRAGDLRLAVLDPESAAGGRPRVRYWAGLSASGQPRWSEREADARPLLHPSALGEVSVRWVPEAGRFLFLGCSGAEGPIGLSVWLRTAENPWGPWSPRHRLLDWVARGMWFDDPYSRFIKALGDGTDPVGDRIFRVQADMTGAAYAPFFFDARADGGELVLRYTLSTWNPYQVVLMAHRLGSDVLGPVAQGSASVDLG